MRIAYTIRGDLTFVPAVKETNVLEVEVIPPYKERGPKPIGGSRKYPLEKEKHLRKGLSQMNEWKLNLSQF